MFLNDWGGKCKLGQVIQRVTWEGDSCVVDVVLVGGWVGGY